MTRYYLFKRDLECVFKTRIKRENECLRSIEWDLIKHIIKGISQILFVDWYALDTVWEHKVNDAIRSYFDLLQSGNLRVLVIKLRLPQFMRKFT